MLQSEIRNMSIECDKVRGLNLSQGVCDTEVPREVRLAAEQAIEEGRNSYTRYDGIAPLREALAAKIRRCSGLDFDPATQIVVSAGATGAFYASCLALLDPGSQVILFEPYYGYHLQTLLAVGAEPRYVKTIPPDWKFAKEDLERAAGPKARGIVVNSPANPSGKVFSMQELEWIRDVVRKRDMFVFTDEIYEHFLFDGRRHLAPATLDGMAERTVTISGLSKTFAVTGWRIGYAAADPGWAETIGHFNDLVYVCAPTPLQYGVAAGLQALGDDYYDGLRREYEAKRAMIVSALDRARLTPYEPQGAYYVLADISRVPGRTSKERAMRLLKDTSVASVPGEAFYSDGGGETLARFCFAKTDEVLAEACRRLERV